MPNTKSKSQKSGSQSNRGFAAMDREKVRKIAKKGGENSHKK
jgi:general stress protein YciG